MAGVTAAERSGTGRARRAAGVGEPAALFLLALGIRLVGLGQPPFVDELYNVLAARSLVEDGTLEIGAGVPYDRARLFTYIVAGMFRLFGESFQAARLPGVIAGALLVALLFVWVRREADRGAAWVSGLLLCFYPYAVANSQILRFYAIHALLFWLAALGLYGLVQRPAAARKNVLIAAGCLACFGLAVHLQPVAAVLGLALAIWLAAVRGRRLVRWFRGARGRRIGTAAGLVLAGALAVTLGLPARLAGAWSLFNYADYWAVAERDNIRFYYDLIGGQLGPLWPALPALFALGAARRPRPVIFAGIVFATAFLFHSLAAWKAERYIQTAMPGLFVVMGIGVAELIRLAYGASLGMARRAGAGAAGLRLARVAFAVVVAATSLAVLDGAAATRQTIRFLTKRAPDRPPPYSNADWQGASGLLRADLDEAEVVVASPDVKALYFLGRLDYDVFAGHLHDGEEFRPDFSIRARTGIPVVRTADGLRRIVDCHATGLVVVERNLFRVEYAVQAEAADALEAELTPVPIPDRFRILAFRWRHEREPGAPCPLTGPGVS